MKKRKILDAISAFVLGILGVSSEAMGVQRAEIIRPSSSDVFPRRCVSVGGECIERPELAAGADLRTGGAQPFLTLILSSIESIDAGCFKSCKSLAFIAFEADSQLATIEENAFCNCSSLRAVCIPSSVKTLGRECFTLCSSLSSVTFGVDSQLTSIGVYAFCSCSSLLTICIPSSVKILDEGCFEGCVSLANVSFENGSQLVAIGDGAFVRTHSLKYVHFPNVIELGLYILNNSGVGKIRVGGKPVSLACGLHAGTALLQADLEIPSVITAFRIGCLAYCRSLKNVTFEEGSQLVSIPENAFFHSTVRSVCIPASVRWLEGCCFSECESLSAVTFESGAQLVRIGEGAFSQSGLLTICIPSSVRWFENGCFSECGFLSTVTFETGSRLREIEVGTFAGSARVRVILPNGKKVPAWYFKQGWKRSESPLLP